VDTRAITQALEDGIAEDPVAVLQMGGQENTRLRIQTIDAEEQGVMIAYHHSTTTLLQEVTGLGLQW